MSSIMPWRSIRSRLQRSFCYDIWNVGIVHKDIDELCSDSCLTDVNWLPRQGRYQFIADPFVLSNADKTTMLVERFEYKGTCKGTISRCEISPDAKYYELHDVLDQDCH